MKLVVGKIEGRKHIALMGERPDEPTHLRVLAYFITEAAADLFLETIGEDVSCERRNA